MSSTSVMDDIKSNVEKVNGESSKYQKIKDKKFYGRCIFFQMSMSTELKIYCDDRLVIKIMIRRKNLENLNMHLM